ncbi:MULTISPECIES: Fe(3+) dicitrate ABC transporter permease subunit FecD [Yersinia]|uniref:Fe(3+) dicitrate ABC transporter permease subunit FecD n=1 Tax=Yersinia TaxID=629 RepID=UPI000BFDA10A|nr:MULTISPECIES: Fe(3+) dicitrate ABC transporter permease subunit FecD [Yersinia]ATM87078.1 iron-dicitrate transporter subunit FecD [Yersinia frederiksenii]MCB5319856.1 Fe(3+) dicitrate ABC transporter permease subunit FecD [Yersinia massiliensis]
MKKQSLTCGVMVLLLLLAVYCSLSFGTQTLGWRQIVSAFNVQDSHHFTLFDYRLPRTLLALVVGASLAVSGVLVQGVIRNPLASPDILGVNHAAGLTSVIALTLFPALSVIWLPPLAFVGGLLAFLLLRLAAGRTSPPVRLALTGVALTALYASLTDFIMLSHPLEINTALLWLTGSLWGRGWGFIYVALPWLLLLLPLSFCLCRSLDVMALGEVSAATLGTSVRWVVSLSLLLAAALAAVSVAICGPIGFIGLVAPHLARRLVGGRHRWMLPASMLIGSLILLLSDLLARTLAPPLELPAGILTAVIGAPYFFWLLMRTR